MENTLGRKNSLCKGTEARKGKPCSKRIERGADIAVRLCRGEEGRKVGDEVGLQKP